MHNIDLQNSAGIIFAHCPISAEFSVDTEFGKRLAGVIRCQSVFIYRKAVTCIFDNKQWDNL